MKLLPVFIFLMAVGGLSVRASTDLPDTVGHLDHKLPRAAVFVDDSDLDALLVTKFTQVQILSRTDLPKITAERLMADGNLKLIGADAAVIVERAGDRRVVRIVDCHSGATMLVLEVPKMPVEETARWIATRTQPLLGSAADPSRPRISLPGLRFVTDSAENRSAERALNLMLATRLQSRGAVVLERWRMSDLVFEKSLVAEESPFWNAARIIDGSVSSEGGRLHARVRLRDAEGAEAFVVAEGDTSGDLADAIVERVVADSRKVAVASGNETEADAFLAEAEWMLKHGLTREAWQATESALALGVSNKREAEMLRVQAAAMCAYPDDLRRPSSMDGGKVEFLEPSELAARVSAATEAMWLAGDYWNDYPTQTPPEWWTLEHPANLGVYSLYTELRLLRAARDSDRNEMTAEAIHGLRTAIQRNVKLLQAGSLGRLRLRFFIYLTQFAAYWNDTPEETIAFYRMVLSPDFDVGAPAWPKEIRAELAYLDSPHPPFLTGTAPKADFPWGSHIPRLFARDETMAREMWAGFMEELARSPSPLNRADSLALRWQSTADQRDRFALTVRMIDFLSENPEALAGPYGEAIFEEFIRPLREVNSSRELASAQQKLVDVFLSLLETDAPLSSTIISCAWVPLSDYKLNARDDQAMALLAALDARQSRQPAFPEERSGINAARSSILQKFPGLKPVINTEGALIAKSLWIAGEHKPDGLRESIGFCDESAVWHDGHLWVLDSNHARLWKIDPASQRTEVVSPDNRPERAIGNQLVVWGQRFAIMADRGVWVLSVDQTRWEKLNLPAARYQIGVAGESLWAVSGEPVRNGHVKGTEGNALYRIRPDLGCELIGSSRRRPAVSPLDSTLAGEPFSVSPARNGGVIIGAWGAPTKFLNSVTGGPTLRSPSGNLKLTSVPGLLIGTKHREGYRHTVVRAEFLETEGDELLLLHPAEQVNSGQVRFTYPKELEELPANTYVAAWRNEGLDILGWASRNSPWGASEAWLVRVDSSGSSIKPLHFDWPAGSDERARAAGHSSNVMRFPLVDPKGLIATEQGLVITGRGMQGFWFIPNTDLQILETRASPGQNGN